MPDRRNWRKARSITAMFMPNPFLLFAGVGGHDRVALSHVKAVAEQLPQQNRWQTFLDYVVAKITRPLPPWHRPGRLEMVG
jgi:hypothetical protein